MRRRQKGEVAGGRVAFEAIEGQRGGAGICGLEERADEPARQAKLQGRAEESAAYDRGYEGARRRCPRGGQDQRDKGEVNRARVFARGPLTVQRASYSCPGCRQRS
jgi:hypothetical protein